jgi:hypothetical protein
MIKLVPAFRDTPVIATGALLSAITLMRVFARSGSLVVKM